MRLNWNHCADLCALEHKVVKIIFAFMHMRTIYAQVAHIGSPDIRPINVFEYIIVGCVAIRAV